ncbi:hypothetical protein [Allorhodopirellula heiligendammensis]|uniref:Uncharacterized protein n=1 Tax=Allorhodopirellula heiligendammensis TaxID=2714739 RepID=A0A5C6C778_9BACT|nr:hypothetical protein [Allorhodopirellula heiligendammensis]TWU19361.1 hypothetical protein Poly21_15330 [Allorhodopirellula heiligendammensis]
MLDEQEINPSQETFRNFLRVLEPLVLAVGGSFLLVGLVSCFSSFGGGSPPRLFWCGIVGMLWTT